MAVYKRFFSKKVVRVDENYSKGTCCAWGMINERRYHQPFKSVKTKFEALAQEDLIVAKIRHGEFDLFKDKTKLADFVEEVYLPYCKIKNVNYRQKIYETNTLNRFFGKSGEFYDLNRARTFGNKNHADLRARQE